MREGYFIEDSYKHEIKTFNQIVELKAHLDKRGSPFCLGKNYDRFK